MTPATIDAAILLHATTTWRKVAFLVAKVAATLPESEEDLHERVASRIAALVAEGKLVAQGDTQNWRYSEVKLP